MLSRKSHTMRLRSRSSSTSVPQDNRPVLGDVSNRTRRENKAGSKDSSVVKPPVSLASNIGTFEATEVASREGNDENSIGVGTRRTRRVRNKRKPPPITRTEDETKKRTKLAEVNDSLKNTNSEEDGKLYTTEKEEREEAPPQVQDRYTIREPYLLQRANFNTSNLTPGIAQHDRENIEDVLQVSNYVSDIYQHLYEEEAGSYPHMYMNRQYDINAKMRAILIDWLIEVHLKFRLVPDTLYLCVNIIDRFCNIVRVRRDKLQLVGVTALLIACKYEEIYPPEVRDCVFITDRAYRREEVLAMEQQILGTLNYRISVPTAYPFMLRFLNVAKASTLTKHAANYYMERTLQEHDLLRYRPSLVSAASVLLALSNPDIIEKEPVRRTDIMNGIKLLLSYTGFNIRDIRACAEVIAVSIGEEPVTASSRQLTTVKRKYNSKRYLHVSRTVSLPHESNIIALVGDRE